MLRNSKGFTLIEFMIVFVILAILAAIAIPNFISMQDRAREGMVKSNMHTLQLAVEDFAAQHDGVYPTALDLENVIALMPQGQVPNNPFHDYLSHITWCGTASDLGDLGYEVVGLNMYVITGYGAKGLLPVTLKNYD